MKNKKTTYYWACGICIYEHGKSSRFKDDVHLLNHIRGSHHGHELEKPLKKIIKHTAIGLTVGIVRV